MFYDFQHAEALKNVRLHSLVLQARQLGNADDQKNKQIILSLLKKILFLAKSGEEWCLYLETLCHLIRYEDELPTIQYAQIFLRDCDTYSEKAIAQYPRGTLRKDIIQCLDNIFNTYKLFVQIDDKKWKQFWSYFQNAVASYGYAAYYWCCRLEFSILNRNIAMATEALEGFKKVSVDYRYNCYTCMQLKAIGYSILVRDTARAEEISNRILSKNVPKGAMWMYDTCPRCTPFFQYLYFLQYSVRTGNTEVFENYVPKYLEAWRLEERTLYTFTAYCHAVVGDFSSIKKELDIAAEDVAERYRTPGWNVMEYMLCWAAYFKRLDKGGVHIVEMQCETEGFPNQDGNGLCRTEALSLWFERQADEIGGQFENSWKQFTYQPLKESYFNCCKV